MRTCLGNARLFRRCSPAAFWWELLGSGGTRALCGIFGSVAKRRIALKSKKLLLGGGENTISFYLKRGVITSIRYLPLQPCLSDKCLETVCMYHIGHRCPSNSCAFRAGYQNKVETILLLKEGVLFFHGFPIFTDFLRAGVHQVQLSGYPLLGGAQPGPPQPSQK